MIGQIVEIQDFFLVVQYTDKDGFVDRRYVPRQLYPLISRKGPVSLTKKVLTQSIPYSDVDLTVDLGDKFNKISIAKLQDAFRQAGLWLRDDYRMKPQVVEKVLRVHRDGDTTLDTATVINAALSNFGGEHGK